MKLINIPEPTQQNRFKNNMHPIHRHADKNPGMYTMSEIIGREFTPPVKAKHFPVRTNSMRNRFIGLYFTTERLCANNSSI